MFGATGNAFGGTATAQSNPFGGGAAAFGAAAAAPVNPFQGGGGGASHTTFGQPRVSSVGAATSFGGGRSSGGRGRGRGGGRGPHGGHQLQGQEQGAFGGAGPSNTGNFNVPAENPFAPRASPSSSMGFGAGSDGGVSSRPPSAPSTPFGQQATGGRGGRGRGGRTQGRGGRGQGGFGVQGFESGAPRRPSSGRGRLEFDGQGEANGFGSGPAFQPPLPPSPSPFTAFGQSPDGQPGERVDNPFAPPSGQTTTTFGGQAQRRKQSFHSSGPPQDHGNPFGGHDVTATSFGHLQQDHKPSFPQSGPSSLESRLSGRQRGTKGRRDAPIGGAFESDDFSNGKTLRSRRKNQTNDDQVGFGNTPGPIVDNNAPMKPALSVRKRQGGAKLTMTPSPPPTPPLSPSRNASGMPVIGDDKNKAELSSAENLDGTCVDMCSPSERELHIRVDELSLFEKCFPGQPGTEKDMIVKRFQRSSADHKLDIPSEIRPPGVLRWTQLYLEQNIMDREKLGEDPRFQPPRVPELIELYNFCWDRCRMIRKDFVLQNYRGAGGRVHPIVLDVHERIARYHILSEHELCEVPSFVAQQNMEQLGQTLKSLNELYDETRKIGDPAFFSPFEAEFRGYFILCTLDNGRGLDVLKFVKGLAPQIRDSRQVVFAMKVFVARHTEDYYQFFKLLRESTYLQACLLFRYIPSMRSQALQKMNRAYRKQPFPLMDLVDVLCFDDMEHAGSVCSHHGLEISADDDADESVLVNFGGEFESDIELRQNKNPLPIRSSHVFVGEKQGECWRRDVCRGVTEYDPEEYPRLSKLIEDSESRERASLYPQRSPYEDEYSTFQVFGADPYEASSNGPMSLPSKLPVSSVSTLSNGRDVDDSVSQVKLEIARRQHEVEKSKAAILQRIQALEKEKLEKERLAKAKAATSELEAKRKAADEAAARQKQAHLETKLREERQRQRELEELRAETKRKQEEAKLAADRARREEETRRVQERLRLEEETRRLEAVQREREIQRQLAEARERQRQEDERIAAEKRRRAAQLRAEREAQRAIELARLKQARRVEKKRLAVLKLRFHVWKKYSTAAKDTPRNVVLSPTTNERPNDVISWLFGGNRAAADQIGLRRRVKQGDDDFGTSIYSDRMWEQLDVPSIAWPGPQSATKSDHVWKVVVADLLDEGLSSFGSWLAVKLGISKASFEDDEQISTVYHTQVASNLEGNRGPTFCCRYVDASFLRVLSVSRQQAKLAGSSSFIFPLDLSYTLRADLLKRWEDRVDRILGQLNPNSKVGIAVLAFCGAGTPRPGDALATAEAATQRIVAKHSQTITFTDGELVMEVQDRLHSEGGNTKLATVLKRLAMNVHRPHVGSLIKIGFSDVLDRAMEYAFAQLDIKNYVTPVEMQDTIHQEFWKLRDTLLSPVIAELDDPVPELEDQLELPQLGWNSPGSQLYWDEVIKRLTSARIHFGTTVQIPSSSACETIFSKISQCVDLLFDEAAAGSMKHYVYELMLPVHATLSAQGNDRPLDMVDVSQAFPWRQILENIYGRFIDGTRNALLYVPADLPIVQPRKQLRNDTVGSMVVAKKKSLDSAAVAAAVAFARAVQKRSPTTSFNDVKQAKKLRSEITQDRVKSQRYHQFLKRELRRCAQVDHLTTT